MNKYSVDSLQPGVRFSHPVFYEDNGTLVQLLEAGMPIYQRHIDKLKELNIDVIYSEGVPIGGHVRKLEEVEEEVAETAEKLGVAQEYSKLRNERRTLEIIYSNGLEMMENIFDDLRLFGSKELNLKDPRSYAKSVIEKIHSISPSNFFPFIYRRDMTEDYLAQHSLNVMLVSLFQGLGLNFSQEEMEALGVGTLLMDIGMIKVPRYILFKADALTPEEMKKVKVHPLHSYKMLLEANAKPNEMLPALEHHEKWNGKGYPRGIKGKEISIFGRVAAVSDAFDAITKPRSYREAKTPYEAMREILARGGIDYDPEIVRNFVTRMSIYPIGSLVRLSDGSIGIVIEANPKTPIMPKVRILFDPVGARVIDEKIIDLSQDHSITIKRPVDEKEISD